MPGDEIETLLDGYIIDIRRGDVLIEIQTRSFSSLRPKLERLIPQYPVHVVHPIAVDRWIVRESDGQAIRRRKSPRHGRVEHVFEELVYIPHLLAHPNLSVEIIFTQEEQTWIDDGRGSWRRKGWRIADRRLVGVQGQQIFNTLEDYRSLLPSGLPSVFANSDVARMAALPPRLAQKMTYTLRKSGAIHLAGVNGRSYIYRLSFEDSIVR
jgi:hypothetical protein